MVIAVAPAGSLTRNLQAEKVVGSSARKRSAKPGLSFKTSPASLICSQVAVSEKVMAMARFAPEYEGGIDRGTVAIA